MRKSCTILIAGAFLTVGTMLVAPPALAEGYNTQNPNNNTQNPNIRNPDVPCVDGAGTPGGSTIPCSVPTARSITTTPIPPNRYNPPGNSPLNPATRRTPATSGNVQDQATPGTPNTPGTPGAPLPPPNVAVPNANPYNR